MMKQRRPTATRAALTVITVAMVAIVAPACSHEQKADHGKAQPTSSASKETTTTTAAAATLQTAPKVKANGQVTFLQTEKGTKVIAEIKGLKPGSVHGLHVHEKGQCQLPDFTSAGGHFNPNGQPHGGPAGEAKHVGDLGNVIANKEGIAKKELLLDGVKLDGPTGVIGKAIVLHANADDLISQPSGDAGDRIGCGVIETAQNAPRDIERK